MLGRRWHGLRIGQASLRIKQAHSHRDLIGLGYD